GTGHDRGHRLEAPVAHARERVGRLPRRAHALPQRRMQEAVGEYLGRLVPGPPSAPRLAEEADQAGVVDGLDGSEAMLGRLLEGEPAVRSARLPDPLGPRADLIRG